MHEQNAQAVEYSKMATQVVSSTTRDVQQQSLPGQTTVQHMSASISSHDRPEQSGQHTAAQRTS